MKSVKLSVWAKENGYTYQGAYDMYVRGQLPNAIQLPSGSIRVQIVEEKKRIETKTVLYARVSTPKQKDDLKRQIERLESFCIANGWPIDKIYSEIASGLNDNRPQLNKILNDNTITRIVVENKDRLTRFGFNYIQHHLNSKECNLVVMNKSNEKDVDLMQDFVSIITSMAARVYGNRRCSNKKKEILAVLEVPENLETLNTNEI